MTVIAVISMVAGAIAAVFAVIAVMQNRAAAHRDLDRNHVAWDLDHEGDRWWIEHTGRDIAHDVQIEAWADEARQVVEREKVAPGERINLEDLRPSPGADLDEEEEVEEDEDPLTPPWLRAAQQFRIEPPSLDMRYAGYEVWWRSERGVWRSDRSSSPFW